MGIYSFIKLPVLAYFLSILEHFFHDFPHLSLPMATMILKKVTNQHQQHNRTNIQNK